MFGPLQELLTSAIGTTLVELGTFWVGIKTDPIGGDSPVGWIHGQLNYLVFAAAILSVIVAGTKMALSNKGQSAREVLKSLLTLIVVMGLAVSVVGVLIEVGDLFSECMIASSVTPGLGTEEPGELSIEDLNTPTDAGWTCEITDDTKKDFGANILAVLGLGGEAAGTGLGIVMVMVVGVWAIVASLIQVAMMIVRNGMLVLLIGVLPLAAAATNTELGRQWFKRCVSWLVAFLLYKPIAALVYAAALRLMSESALAVASGTGSATDFATSMKNGITGGVMMTLAILALPALMRFVTPLVAASAGGAGALGTLTTAGQMANQMVTAGDDGSTGPSGAAEVGGPGGSQGQSGQSGQRGPKGAKTTGPSKPGAKPGGGGGGGGGQGGGGQGGGGGGGGQGGGGGGGGGGQGGGGGGGGGGQGGGGGGLGGSSGGGGGGGGLGGGVGGGPDGSGSGGGTGGPDGSSGGGGTGGPGGSGGQQTGSGPDGSGGIESSGSGPGGAAGNTDAVERDGSSGSTSNPVDNDGATGADRRGTDEGPSGSN